MINEIVKAFFNTFKPPPILLVSEWAENERRLSPESSAEPGRWYNSTAPHLIAPMDALSSLDYCQEVVMMFASQTGKTEVLNNFVGYIIDQDPAPILVIQPNQKPMGEAWSKDRLAPMIRDTPSLKEKVKDAKSRDSGNTMMHKSFPGGHITIGGSNSPAGLASRPIRYLLFDEINRFVVTKEGDAVKLATKRTTTFWNRKILKVSSPTYENVGISYEYDLCLQFEWQLKCLHCDDSQFPQLKHFKWEREKGQVIDVEYICESCGAIHSIKDELKIKGNGLYIQMNDLNPKKKGFKCNQWASPFASWTETITEFLDAGKDPAKLQTVTNTAFAENWLGTGEIIDDEILFNRREEYAAQVPKDALYLSCGVDIQGDRIEYEVIGWNETENSWSIEYGAFIGDPLSADVWVRLSDLLSREFEHENGHKIQITTMCVDSGYLADIVYGFCHKYRTRGVFAIKGVEGEGAPVVKRANKVKLANSGKQLQLYTVGNDTCKGQIFSRLELVNNEHGACHWPIEYDHDYFLMLTAEKKVVKYIRGFPKTTWEKIRPRNEAIDTRQYAMAALKLGNPDFKRLSAILNTKPEILAEMQSKKAKKKVNQRYSRKGL